MNEPNVPDNNKDWNNIDIFLFSNGQQYSPPRKYHLQSDELQFWETTLHYMAQTQFGSMTSMIEIYTLNGKKLDNPLELTDATSYVAVKPPDAFIPAGYEQYLIRASRSWEKRQEKINNMIDTGEKKKKERSKSTVDEIKQIETANIQNPQSSTEKDFNSVSTNNTFISQLRKSNNTSFDEKPKTYKSLVSRRSIDKNFKTNPSQIVKTNSKDYSILNKQRNISLAKNLKPNSSKRQSTTTKSEKNVSKININSPKEKIQSNITKIPEDVEIKEITLSKPNFLNDNQSREVSNWVFNRDQTISTDVYKNPESDNQSIYIDTDKNHFIKECQPKEKVDMNNELENSLKPSKAISMQSFVSSNCKHGPEISTSFASRAKVFNIKLNIEVRDDRDSIDSQKNYYLGKCKSNTALITTEQEAQADLNINLKEEDFEHENMMPKTKTLISDKSNSDVGNGKLIIINCTCGLLEAKNIINTNKDNFVLLVPSTFADKNDERSHPDNDQPEKYPHKPHHSILNMESLNSKSNIYRKENSQIIIKHKVSISPDSPIKINAVAPFETKDDKNNAIVNHLLKQDQFTQTEWYNILLQARPQANGLYSFHLPPLHVLTQYNLL